jgi:hypothetical protein
MRIRTTLVLILFTIMLHNQIEPINAISPYGILGISRTATDS